MKTEHSLVVASSIARARLRPFGSAAVAILCVWFLSGCALFGGLRVEHTATSVQRPSNVAIYLSTTLNGDPVTDLKASNFRIYEDGQLLPAEQTQQTLLDRDVAAVHRTLLLVDMSGPITEGTYRDDVARAAGAFVTSVRTTQPVAVYAFDGGRNIRPLGDYVKGEEVVELVPELANYTSQDPSSNLHAAVIEAIQKLDARLMMTPRPLRVGTLVVFAQGPDLAGRATENQMRDALDETTHHVMAIGIEGTGFSPASIGKSKSFTATSKNLLKNAFSEAAKATADTYLQYYLLSYCSPARAGERQVEVEVVTKDPDGQDVTGHLYTEMNADGFRSGCNPNTTPRFVKATRPEHSSVEAETEDESNVPAERSTGADPPAGPASTKPARQPAEDDDEIVPPPDKPGYAQ